MEARAGAGACRWATRPMRCLPLCLAPSASQVLEDVWVLLRRPAVPTTPDLPTQHRVLMTEHQYGIPGHITANQHRH